MLDKLLEKTRSHRTFDETEISIEDLKKLVATYKVSSSSRNSQNLRFVIINSKELCKKIFTQTAWAGSIAWNPKDEQRPKAYVFIVSLKSSQLTQLSLGIDIGIVAQNISLKATDLGFDSCMIGAFNRGNICKLLDIDEFNYTPQLLIALGKATDKVVLIDGTEKDLNYQRDIEKNIHYVPKLPLETLILKEFKN